MTNLKLKAIDQSDRPKYIPTEEDKRRAINKVDSFKMSGDGVFHTVQGEGIRSGYPITFVRLHFCNLSCTWCDAYYTWKKEVEEYWKEPWDLPISSLHTKIREIQETHKIPSERHIYRVCFTGGEPLIQQNKIQKFIEENPEYYVEIETNGTVMPNEYLLKRNSMGKLFFNCSPKLENSGNPHLKRFQPNVIACINNTINPIFKFVCGNNNDIEEALHEYGNLITRENFSIMPEGVTKEENSKVYEDIIEKILEYGLHTSVRGQNVIFDGSKRGV